MRQIKEETAALDLALLLFDWTLQRNKRKKGRGQTEVADRDPARVTSQKKNKVRKKKFNV